MTTQRENLRRLRLQRGLSQEALAHAMGIAPQTYGEWERGTATPRVGFRPRLARALAVTLEEVHRLLDGDGQAPVPEGFAVPSWLTHYAALEQGASYLWAFEPIVIHGLLQTAAYAYTVESSSEEFVPDEVIVERVEARLARQAVLDRNPDPLELSVILDESVLYRDPGDRDMLAAQLDYLIQEASRPNVDLRVLPFGSGAFAAAFGSFTLLNAPGRSEPYMACVRDRAGPHYLDRRHEVEVHVRLFTYLKKAALSPEASAERIRTIKKERYS